MAERRYVLFDLDGTLTDPEEGIGKSLTYALEKLGYQAPTAEQVHELIGPPIREGFASLGVAAEQIEEAISLYRERYVPIGLYENAVIEGLPELLNELLNAEVIMAVATSKVEIYAREILQHFGLLDFFTVVAGASLDGHHAEKATVIADCLHRLGYLAGESAIMVGDRLHDVQGALVNDLPCIGVSWGFARPGELHDAGAIAVVSSTAQLRAQLVDHCDLSDTLSTTEWSGS
jgi:phosphoglycolate phosphatase